MASLYWYSRRWFKSIAAVKQYFAPPDVTNKELIDLKKNDPEGWDEIVTGVAKELGVEID